MISRKKLQTLCAGHLTAVWDCLTSKNETLCQFLYLFILHTLAPDYLLAPVKICIEVTLCSWHAVQIQEVTHLSQGSDKKMSSFWIRKHSASVLVFVVGRIMWMQFRWRVHTLQYVTVLLVFLSFCVTLCWWGVVTSVWPWWSQTCSCVSFCWLPAHVLWRPSCVHIHECSQWHLAFEVCSRQISEGGTSSAASSYFLLQLS